MTSALLRVVVADDERPARSYLVAMLQTFEHVAVVGEVADGLGAIEIIERERPDLALLDLQMPEMDGLAVVRSIKPALLPLVAFVTAYDDHAVRAFELDAIDYLLKPVGRLRLAETLRRAEERLEGHARPHTAAPHSGAPHSSAPHSSADAYAADSHRAAIERAPELAYLERLPIRTRDAIRLMPVADIASVVADGELLHITAQSGERHTINHRLKDIEARLDPARFLRLSRGALVNRLLIEHVHALPGGTYAVTLKDGRQFGVSRMRSRVLRSELKI